MGRSFLSVLLFLLLSLGLFAEPIIYNCRDFGAVGDGHSDDGEIIQQVLDRAGASANVILPAGTYLVQRPLFIRNDNVSLSGESPEKTIICFAPEKISDDLRQRSAAISLRGLTEYQWFAVNRDVLKGENTVETTAPANFSPGDLIEIVQDVNKTNFRQYMGIFRRVKNISDNHITLDFPVEENFSPAQNSRVRRYLPRKNITMENFTILLSSPVKNNYCGIEVAAAENVFINNIHIVGFGKTAVFLDETYGCGISSNTFRDNRCGILLNHSNENLHLGENQFLNCRKEILERNKHK